MPPRRAEGTARPIAEGYLRSFPAGSTEFGRCSGLTNLGKMSQSYRMFEIRDAVRLERGRKNETRRVSFRRGGERLPVSGNLTWNHYRLLMQVEDAEAKKN